MKTNAKEDYLTTININDMDVYYELHGQGRPLVLIAGYASDHTYWQGMLDELAKFFQVLIFDNRGVGQTKDQGASFSLEMMANDTMALVGHLGLMRPHILGHSMGGAIAQIIAKKYFDKISKLLILNSAAKFNRRTIFALNSLLNLRKEEVSFDLLIDACIPWLFSSSYMAKSENITGFKEYLKNNPYFQSIEDQERQFHAILQFDFRNWLSNIMVPTLVIASEDDIVDLPKESQQLARNISNAQFITIAGGHSSPIEQPKELNEAILKFLA